MDFSKLCRLCLGSNALSPIFGSSSDHRRQTTAVFITTGIKVIFNDGLPQQMCATCTSYINSSLKFRRQCKASEGKLIVLMNRKQATYKDDREFVDDIKTECDMLKMEFKSESQDMETIKYERSDVENGALISLTEHIHKEERSEAETKSVKVREDGKSKKIKVQRVCCAVCGKELSPRSLRAHMAARHEADLRCQYCKTEHLSKEALAAHSAKCPKKRKRAIPDSGKEMVPCEVCNKVMQRSSLRMHRAVKHNGQRPICEHCGRSFGNKLRLIEHLRAKHGHDKLQCAHCEFKSSSSAALQNHERRHRGEKPFVCETCGAKFHAAYLLAQHRHSHRTEKLIKCGICGAAFKAANSLHSHRAARHGARRHRCPLYRRVYACRHYAVKHMRAVHGFKGTVPPLQVDPDPT